MQTEGAGKPLGDQNLMAGGNPGPSSTNGVKPSSSSAGGQNTAPSGCSSSVVTLGCIIGAWILAGAMFVL